jgi:hypothetical protein
MGEPSDSSEPAASKPAEPIAPKPTIHEAELEPGPSGRVLRGAEIDFNAAVGRRHAAGNVVVCGNETAENRRVAGQIESIVGQCVRADPHIQHAGKFALPHY